MNLEAIKAHPAAQKSIAAGEFWQAILDVGFSTWRQPEHRDWSYGEMVDYVGATFGEAAKFFILLGKYNHQVCNGGHIQYYANGFADGNGGCMGYHDEEIPRHKELVTLFRKYKLANIQPHGAEVLAILEAFRITTDTEDRITEVCSECNGSRHDGEEVCEACGGSGEEEVDNENYGEVDNMDELEELNTRYFKICTEFEKAVDVHVKAWFETGVDPLKDSPATDLPKVLQKPRLQLVGTDGNAYAVMARAEEALRKAGHPKEVIDEYLRKARSGSYDNLLQVTMEYCEVI